MKKKLTILYCTPEVTPFSKTGGLGDVAGSLPRALSSAGCDVRIITPKYAGISDSTYKLKKVIDNIPVRIGTREEAGGLYEGKLPGSKVPVYFVSSSKYFLRKDLYQENGKDYDDNLERFSFFSMMALHSMGYMGCQPDIIHCNDWQTALIPVYLKTVMKAMDIGTLFTIHNIGYQGLFKREQLPITGLDWKLFNIKGLEYFGQINLLKGGIIYSDIVTTVSPSYSREIQTEEYGCGLEGVLQERRKDLYGIINGVDYDEWDPSQDNHISVNYSIKTIGRKKECKKELQKKCGLPVKDKPLIGMVSRLDDHKGYDILAEIMDELMQLDVQMVMLGTGKAKYQDLFKKYEKKYPDKLSLNLFFDNTLAHMIEAGSDLFLIPSKYEPCGLSQLYSLKYGTIPVAHKTGGLSDTITDFVPSAVADNKATGFLFSHYSPDDLLKAVLLSLYVYEDKATWKKLVTTGMKADYSWTQPAREYIRLYEKLIIQVPKHKKGGFI
ncbi:MAG: glycogen synthase GlgA [Nitrospirae bacterium]|nr:glycogen synthase GlgA [Nitrospirota bacterium]